jgi:hypothetical protein
MCKYSDLFRCSQKPQAAAAHLARSPAAAAIHDRKLNDAPAAYMRWSGLLIPCSPAALTLYQHAIYLRLKGI